LANNALAPGSYDVVACAWEMSELPAQGPSLDPFDASRCMKSSFVVAAASLTVTELDIPQPISGAAFDASSQSTQPLAAIPHFVIKNVGAVATSASYYRYEIAATTAGAEGFGAGGTTHMPRLAPGETVVQEFANLALNPGGYSVLACAYDASELPTDSTL